MADDQLIFGLAEHHYREIVRVFKRHEGIEQVLIFGSRAKGSEKPYSDIDLAVIAPGMDDGEFTRLWHELDSLELVFKLDLLHWDRLSQQNLREAILKQGQIFYKEQK